MLLRPGGQEYLGGLHVYIFCTVMPLRPMNSLEMCYHLIAFKVINTQGNLTMEKNLMSQIKVYYCHIFNFLFRTQVRSMATLKDSMLFYLNKPYLLTHRPVQINTVESFTCFVGQRKRGDDKRG